MRARASTNILLEEARAEDYIERLIPVLKSMRISPEISTYSYYYDGITYDIMLIVFKEKYVELIGYHEEFLSSFEI